MYYHESMLIFYMGIFSSRIKGQKKLIIQQTKKQIKNYVQQRL
jgi:hypothetical protein